MNAHGYQSRQGNTFGVGSVHKLLTNTVYIGTWRFNQASSRTRQRKPQEEIVEVSVPAIVDYHIFSCVQRQLRTRKPIVTPPRAMVGPTLLTGLALCATCRGAMMPRTGTSKSGRIYRCYTCSSCATNGKTICRGWPYQWVGSTGCRPITSSVWARDAREPTSGSAPFRKTYDHNVRIAGSKDLMEKTVLASQIGQPRCSQTSTEWRARRDSNSRPLDS
ncbi:MAG: recombinase family protein [Methylocapsa sp.]|nr:recombinase family protein [Methylocapsa sp.]